MLSHIFHFNVPCIGLDKTLMIPLGKLAKFKWRQRTIEMRGYVEVYTGRGSN